MEYATEGERRAARKLVRHLLKTGTVSVNDGEEWTLVRSKSETEVLHALATTGMDTLRWRDDRDGSTIGSFMLIYGNAPDGSELIGDHSDNHACCAAYEAIN